MSTERCERCRKPGTVWDLEQGHLCQDCESVILEARRLKAEEEEAWSSSDGC